MSRNVFGTYHPIINFIFYVGAFLFGVFLRHPMYLVCSVVCSITYYLFIIRGSRWKMLMSMVVLFMLLSVLNPVFNRMGDTVLFVYGNGRNYTLEAFYYGMALAALLISVLGWFGSYNVIMTSDKFVYLFGRWFPTFSMIFTMVLRFVPNYQKRIVKIQMARQGIGKYGEGHSWRQKAGNGLQVVSALTTWALEGGIATADSMKSRGYGSGKRTRFSIYRFDYRDWLLLLWLLVTAGATGYCIIAGGAEVAYIPTFSMKLGGHTISGVIAYTLFLITPMALQIWEDITWHILKSRI